MTSLRVVLAAAGAAALVGAASVRAADTNAALQQEVKALREIVLDLQKRVAELEAHAPAAIEAVPEAAQPVPAASQTASVPMQAAPAPTQTAPAPMPTAPTPLQSAPAPEPAATISAAAHVEASSGYVSAEAALRAKWSKVVKEMDQDEVTRLLGEPSKKSTLDGRTVWYYFYPGTGRGSVFFTDAGRVSSRQSPFGFGW